MKNPFSIVPLLPLLLVAIAPLQAANLQQVRDSAFVGRWGDTGSSITMRVKADQGILRITGGDQGYSYTLGCLVKDMEAICTGSGGLLQGSNFLYQSTIRLNKDGSALEHWKAFNNDQKVEGKTTWRRLPAR